MRKILINLCPHEINIAPYTFYKGGGREWTIEVEKSGKIVRTKKFLPKGIIDPYMCKEIRDILSGYGEFYTGGAFAIVSNMCLDHVDKVTAMYTFAPEPMKNSIKFEDGGEARLRLIGSSKYPARVFSYPPSEKEKGDDIFPIGSIEVRIPIDSLERQRLQEEELAWTKNITKIKGKNK